MSTTPTALGFGLGNEWVEKHCKSLRSVFDSVRIHREPFSYYKIQRHRTFWWQISTPDFVTIKGIEVPERATVKKRYHCKALTVHCRLMGSYESLKGGATSEAMEDFTGGVTETFDFRQNVPANMFHILDQAYKRCSLMGCSIEVNTHLYISSVILVCSYFFVDCLLSHFYFIDWLPQIIGCVTLFYFSLFCLT